MLLPGLFWFFIFINSAHCLWYNDIISPNGWHFGDGMKFHIEDTKAKNSTFFDRIALRVDYGNIEVSALPKPEKEAVQLDFIVKDQQEGRSSKKTMGNLLIPFWLGAAKGTAVTMLLSGMKLMALKSLLLAKVAVVISAIIIAAKFFKKTEPYYVEVEQTAGSQHIPYYEFAPGASHAVGYSPYHAYAPSAAEASNQYAVVNVAGENETAAVVASAKQSVATAARRRDSSKRKPIPTATVLTIKSY